VLPSRDNLGRIFTPAPVNRVHPLNRGRVAWWLSLPGLMGGRQFFDLMGLNHGTLTSMGTGSGWQGSVRGCGQLNFDGTNDYVSIPDCPSLNPTIITLAATVFDTSAAVDNAYRGILMKRNSSLSNQAAWAFDRQRNADGQSECRFYFNIAGTYNIWKSNGLSHAASTVERLVVTYSAAGAPVFYRNGVAASSAVVLGTGNPSLPANTSVAGWGTYPTFNSQDFPWLGWMDDASIWSRPLSAAEVMQDYILSRQGYPGVLNRLSSRVYSVASASPPSSTLFRRSLTNRTGSRSAA
jgi:hypothetical protein